MPWYVRSLTSQVGVSNREFSARVEVPLVVVPGQYDVVASVVNSPQALLTVTAVSAAPIAAPSGTGLALPW